MLLNGERYAIGNEVYAVGEGPGEPCPSEEPSRPSRLPAFSPSGRYVAGTLQSHEGISRSSTPHDEVARYEFRSRLYVTLEEGLITGAAAFSPDSEVLAISSGASGLGRTFGDLQLVSLKRERWSPIIPAAREPATSQSCHRMRHVVVRKEPPSTRSSTVAARRSTVRCRLVLLRQRGLVARLEDGKQWVITDTASKRDIAVPANGSRDRVLSGRAARAGVSEHLYAGQPSSPQALADSQPFPTTWSYPGAKLVLGVYADQIVRMPKARCCSIGPREKFRPARGPSVLVLSAKTVVARRDQQARGQPLDIPLPWTRERLVKVVDIEHQPSLRRGEHTEVR